MFVDSVRRRETDLLSSRNKRGGCGLSEGSEGCLLDGGPDPSSAFRPCVFLYTAGLQRGVLSQRSVIETHSIPIKSTVTEPEGLALLIGSGALPVPSLIDSVKRLINVECSAAGGQQASYLDRLKVTVSCSTLPFLSTLI